MYQQKHPLKQSLYHLKGELDYSKSFASYAVVCPFMHVLLGLPSLPVFKHNQNKNYGSLGLNIYMAFPTFMQNSKVILLNAKDNYDHFTVPLTSQSTPLDEYCYNITIYATIYLIVDSLQKLYIICNIKLLFSCRKFYGFLITTKEPFLVYYNYVNEQYPSSGSVLTK